MEPQEKIDYLAIGHICHDLTPAGKVIGGTAAYASALASAAGCRTAVVTSSAVTDDWKSALPDVEIHQIPSRNTTVFENVYTPSGRVQVLHSLADKIKPGDIPVNWQRASIVHLGPIANEVDPEMVHLFSNSILGLTPQGWMRGWDDKGQVFKQKWLMAERYLRKAAVVFLSDEDIPDQQTLMNYRQWTRLLVLTRGRDGCTLFAGDEVTHVPVARLPEIETTGAGDIFAAAFLIRFHQTAGNYIEAAKFANRIAAQSISYSGLMAKIDAVSKSGFYKTDDQARS